MVYQAAFTQRDLNLANNPWHVNDEAEFIQYILAHHFVVLNFYVCMEHETICQSVSCWLYRNPLVFESVCEHNLKEHTDQTQNKIRENETQTHKMNETKINRTMPKKTVVEANKMDRK